MGICAVVPEAPTQEQAAVRRGLLVLNPAHLGLGAPLYASAVLGSSGPRDLPGGGFCGLLLSFHECICPLSLGLSSLCLLPSYC